MQGAACSNEQEVSLSARPFEFMMNALRLKDGFELMRFQEPHRLDPGPHPAAMAQAEAQGLLARDLARAWPTEKGLTSSATCRRSFCKTEAALQFGPCQPTCSSDSTVAFIEREVAIDLTSCSATLRPSSCRGFACRVSPDRRRITVFVRRIKRPSCLRCPEPRPWLPFTACLKPKRPFRSKATRSACRLRQPKTRLPSNTTASVFWMALFKSDSTAISAKPTCRSSQGRWCESFSPKWCSNKRPALEQASPFQGQPRRSVCIAGLRNCFEGRCANALATCHRWHPQHRLSVSGPVCRPSACSPDLPVLQ